MGTQPVLLVWCCGGTEHRTRGLIYPPPKPCVGRPWHGCPWAPGPFGCVPSPSCPLRAGQDVVRSGHVRGEGAELGQPQGGRANRGCPRGLRASPGHTCGMQGTSDCLQGGSGGDWSPSMCRAATVGCQRYRSQGLAGGWGLDPAPEGSQHGAAISGGCGFPSGGGRRDAPRAGPETPPTPGSTNPAGSAGSGPAAASEAGSDLEAIVGSRRCRETTCPCVYCGGRRAATCRRDGAGAAAAPPVGPRAPCREGSCTQNPPSAGPGERQAKGSAGATAAEGLHGAGVCGGCSQSPLVGPPQGFSWLCGVQKGSWGCIRWRCRGEGRG
ncbi:collagen alpha-1(I) chain-like [Cygnus olor]|uniref:collagen alpha-1(I) chain-like n=1 Tax=Cygnus olor TaxID=8869 RepID=UPI001ADE9B13|nr:collagen alpha-1(I) chain-like [Cygnus olor]